MIIGELRIDGKGDVGVSGDKTTGMNIKVMDLLEIPKSRVTKSGRVNMFEPDYYKDQQSQDNLYV